MKIWKLESINWHGYDTNRGFIIAALNEYRAREIAAQQSGDESESVWLDPSQSKIQEISQNLDEGVILVDFLAG